METTENLYLIRHRKQSWCKERSLSCVSYYHDDSLDYSARAIGNHMHDDATPDDLARPWFCVMEQDYPNQSKAFERNSADLAI